MIKAIIFDMDGVLIDAVHTHYLALNRALSLFGYNIPQHEHDSLYNGLPTRVKLDLLGQRNGFPTALAGFVCEMKQRYTLELLAGNCLPDARLTSLLRHLKHRGFAIGLASNSIRNTVDVVIDKMGIAQFFDVVLSNEDVAKSKPDPEIYLKAFRALKLSPEECMVIEDSIPGIQAARQATPNVLIVANPTEVTQERIDAQLAKLEATEAPRPRSDAAVTEVLIPMAGLGQRFVEVGYEKPKPLIDVFGKPMIQWVVENIRPKNFPSHFTFLCSQKHLNEFQLESFLKKIAPGCSVVSVPNVTQGAACTALVAKGHIDADRPLVLGNSDQLVDVPIDDFLRAAHGRDADGSIMTFPATEKKWSYAKTDESGRVTEVAEKNPISPHATVGIYYFRRGADFVRGAEEMILQNIRTNGEFYVCPVFNQIIARGKRVYIHEISASAMHGLGTPDDLQSFLTFKKAA